MLKVIASIIDIGGKRVPQFLIDYPNTNINYDNCNSDYENVFCVCSDQATLDSIKSSNKYEVIEEK